MKKTVLVIASVAIWLVSSASDDRHHDSDSTLTWVDYQEASGPEPFVHRATLEHNGTLGPVSDVVHLDDAGGLGLADDGAGTLFVTTAHRLWAVDAAGLGRVLQVQPFDGADVAYDRRSKFLYWSDHAETGAIHRARWNRENGSLGPEEHIIAGLSRPNALALVRSHGDSYLYWSTVNDSQGRLVQRVRLNGARPGPVEAVVQLAVAPPQFHAADGIAVEPERKLLFWIQRGRNSVSVASLERLPIRGPERDIPLDGGSDYMALSPDRSELYLTVWPPEGSPQGSTIVAIDIGRGARTPPTPRVLARGYQAHGLLVTSDSRED